MEEASSLPEDLGGQCDSCGREVPMLYGVMMYGIPSTFCAPCLRTKIMGLRLRTSYDKLTKTWKFDISVHGQVVHTGTGFPSQNVAEEAAQIVWFTVSSAIFAFSNHNFQESRKNAAAPPVV